MPCSGSRPAVVSAFLRGAARTSSARPRFDTTDGLEQNAMNDLHQLNTLEARQNLFSRDGMLPDSDAACVIDSVRDCGRNGTNAGFAEALHSVEPAGFQAVHVDLRHLRNIHNCG